MHFTVGQKKLLTHIKRKRFYINFFSLQSANQMLHNRPFFKLRRGLALPTSPPPIVHKPFPHSNKIDIRKINLVNTECEKINLCDSIFIFDNRK